MSKQLNGLEIAIIGMAGRFPGAQDIEGFWSNLVNGKETITFFSQEELADSEMDPEMLSRPDYVRAKGYLENCERFDASFFNYSPLEAEVMDPQVRIFHECVWEALEDAGYCADTYSGLIGMYAGAASNLYWQSLSFLSDSSKLLGPFSANQLANKDFMSMQISHRLNLKGPSITVNTACSTSLVAVHLAAQALLNGECDIALAGGVSVSLPLKSGYQYQEGMILSPDGHCRPFDEEGQGSVPGNGAGVVVLKRYEEAVADGDHIYAVIKGSAINNDGTRKSAYTAPSVEGQVEVIQTAQQLAEVDFESIQFVETHGTGTILGDPIELEALRTAFGSGEGVCRIGSVKSNIGHLDVAAGVAGLIKATLSLQHKLLPPTLHFKKLNPKIDLSDSPFVINSKLIDLSTVSDTLRAGVSSFGIGGTNAHVILEEAPTLLKSSKGRGSQLILISAKSESALDQSSKNLADYIRNNPDVSLADLAFTLQIGRKAFEHRRFIVANHTDELADILQTIGNEKGKRSRKIFTSAIDQTDKKIVFMFPGLGNQYVEMGLGLYRFEPLFKKELDHCFEILDRYLDVSIKEWMFPQTDWEQASQKIKQIDISQLVVFIFEYALGKYLMELGVKPAYMIGYSFGEFAAACLAGVFSLEDAIRVIIRRGQLIKLTEEGAMLSVPMTEAELVPLLPANLSLCIVNGPSCVVGGTKETVEQFEEQLKSLRQICIRLDTSHALHSDLMKPIKQAFAEEMKQIPLHPPLISFISNMTGDWITAEEATDPDYWARQLTDPIRFARGLQEILQEDALTFIEVGPDRNLSALLRYFIQRDSSHTILNIIRNPQEKVDDLYYLYTRLGQIWGAGHSIDWVKLYQYEKRNRLSLPTYPFEREYHWLDGNPFHLLNDKQIARKLIMQKKPHIEDWFYAPLWQQKVLPPNAKLADQQTFLVFANRDSLSNEVIRELSSTGQVPIVIYEGVEFAIDERAYTVNPTSSSDYEKLFVSLTENNIQIDHVLHLWSAGHKSSAPLDVLAFHKTQQTGFYSIMYIVRCIQRYDRHRVIRMAVVTNEAMAVTGQETLFPEHSPLIGLGHVIPQELQNIRHLTVDIQTAALEAAEDVKRMAQMVVEEFAHEISDRLIAYRHFQRWVPSYQPIKLTEAKTDPFRKNGVYVITGGAGMIGWIIGSYLAKQYQATIAIIQRSFPLKQEWTEWLKNHPEDDPRSMRIREMMEAEQLGATIEVYRGQVDDYPQMSHIIAEIEATHGSIHGVFHCAANMGDQFLNPIDQLNADLCQTIFQPKIDGLLVLDQVLEQKSLDFCLLMSSTAAVLGGYGFAAYSAANVFMDSYTNKRNKQHSVKWKTIDWEAWRNHEKVEIGYQSSIGDLAMTPEEGIEALRRVLSVDRYHHLVHSPGDLEMRLDQWIRFQGSPEGNAVTVKSARKKRKNTSSMVDYEKPSNQLEQRIAEIWEEFLGIQEISTHDNFFDLGATSLTLIRMKSILDEEFNRQIPIVDLFANPTISSLAKRIQQDENDANDEFEEKRLKEREVVGRDLLTKQLHLRKKE
ncbi:type I polyketide synthase [Brevibacillus sp. MS2.2]|uniref:type I polyketide synthase n=1 Tax=Brevibacillus sp. MS2.2 TaxID=2738981 RepID=UPI00156AFA0F|nr:type I polyketide synthase [Brevibacillus sp. MS2.2]NRR24474.1 KR domain-containing protein [Brevibacillus sp. MS2.2]